MGEMDKDKKNVLNRLMCKVSYSGGTVCAKISALTNGIDLTKVSGSIKGSLGVVKNKSIATAKELKETAVSIKKSFVSGMKSVNKSINDVGEELVKNKKKVEPEEPKVKITESNHETKAPTRTEEIVESKEPSSDEKEISKKILNKDFEEEIKKIDKKLLKETANV